MLIYRQLRAGNIALLGTGIVHATHVPVIRSFLMRAEIVRSSERGKMKLEDGSGDWKLYFLADLASAVNSRTDLCTGNAHYAIVTRCF